MEFGAIGAIGSEEHKKAGKVFNTNFENSATHIAAKPTEDNVWNARERNVDLGGVSVFA